MTLVGGLGGDPHDMEGSIGHARTANSRRGTASPDENALSRWEWRRVGRDDAGNAAGAKGNARTE